LIQFHLVFAPFWTFHACLVTSLCLFLSTSCFHQLHRPSSSHSLPVVLSLPLLLPPGENPIGIAFIHETPHSRVSWRNSVSPCRMLLIQYNTCLAPSSSPHIQFHHSLRLCIPPPFLASFKSAHSLCLSFCIFFRLGQPLLPSHLFPSASSSTKQ
jgi:hypothetical protein